jgi:CheY-like chemotaxis protein
MQAAMPQSGAALLVDDEEYIRLSTADMLTELGFSVHEAASAEAALRAIDAGLQPDILITDHLMPGMTGVELAHAVKIRRPAMKVLIVSGFAEGDGIDPSLPRLTKPFVQSDLAAALAALREH